MKVKAFIAILAVICMSYGMIGLPNGVYGFTSEDGEFVKVIINNPQATITASGYYMNLYLKVDDDGDFYYRNKSLKSFIAFDNPCTGMVSIRGNQSIIYNNAPICQ